MRGEELPASLATVAEMRWGLSIALAGELADPAALADVATAAEAAGWDGVFVLGPPVEPHRCAVRRSVGDAGRGRHSDRARGRSARWSTALPRAVARSWLPRPPRRSTGCRAGGWCSASASVSTATGSTRCSMSRPTTTGARGAALDAGIEALLPMLGGGPVPAAGGRVTTAAGVQEPRRADLDRRADRVPRRPAPCRPPRPRGPGARRCGRVDARPRRRRA